MSGRNQQDDNSDPQHRIAGPGNGMPYPDDEISLFDIWDALVRRRWIIISITAFFTILALAFALIHAKSYGYRTTIQIGSYVPTNKTNNSGRKLIESINDAQNQLVNAYIPAARQALDKQNKKPPKVNVEAKQGHSSVLVLHTKAPADKASLVKKLHQNILDHLKQHDKKILGPIKARRENHLKNTKHKLAFTKRSSIKNAKLEPFKQKIQKKKQAISELRATLASKKLKLNNQIADQRRQVEHLKDKGSQLKSRLNHLSIKKKLANNQLDSQQKLASRLEKASAYASNNIQSSGDAMSVLTVGTQINKIRNNIDKLQNRLQIKLPEKRSKLNAKIKSNERAQKNAADKVNALQNQLTQLQKLYNRKQANAKQKVAAAKTRLATAKANYTNKIENKKSAVKDAKVSLHQLSNTHAVDLASRSIKPVSSGNKTIVVLGFILGLMFSLFLALIVEFAASARERRLATNSD